MRAPSVTAWHPGRVPTWIPACVLVGLATVPARADIPPPATYVETCTIAKQQTTASECLTCGAYYGDISRCTTMLSPYCYTKVCKTYGASSWSEVLCRTKSADAPVVPSDIIGILSAASTPGPASAADGGVPSACAGYTPPATGTATQTATVTQIATVTQTATGTQTASDPSGPTPGKTGDDSSGCSVTTGSSAVRALGPLTVLLAGLALLVLRRRSRR